MMGAEEKATAKEKRGKVQDYEMRFACGGVAGQVVEARLLSPVIFRAEKFVALDGVAAAECPTCLGAGLFSEHPKHGTGLCRCVLKPDGRESLVPIGTKMLAFARGVPQAPPEWRERGVPTEQYPWNSLGSGVRCSTVEPGDEFKFRVWFRRAGVWAASAYGKAVVE